MKRYIAFLLSFVLLLSFSSCALYEKVLPTPTSPEPTVPDPTAPDETTTQPQAEVTTPTPEEEKIPTGELIEVDPFGYYYGILEAWRVAVRRLDFLADSDVKKIAQELELESLSQAEQMQTMMQAADSFYPYSDRGVSSTTPERLTYFGYMEKDINQDGIKELIILTEDCQIVAIYTNVQRAHHNVVNELFWISEAALLATYSPTNSCWIDAEGLIHVNNYRTGFRKYHAVYEINKGGEGLTQLIEYGEDFTWYANHDHLYKIADGTKTEITQAEFDALDAQYGKYLTQTEQAKVNREQAGLVARPLYLPGAVELHEAMYRPVFNGEKQVLVEKTGRYIFLDAYVPTDGISLAKRETLRYMYHDVGDDGLWDAVIDCGSDKLCLTYKNGKVTLKTLSEKEWESIPSYLYYRFSALGAPWRQSVLSPEEIEEIASLVWGIRDGDGDGAAGTYYLHYIDVAEAPDEDGYYLVTWRLEAYGWCGDDACTETDPNHRHLNSVKAFRYMLIHERTGEVLDDACVSPAGAQRFAAEHWGFADGAVIHGWGKTFVIRIKITDDFGYNDVYYNAYLSVKCYFTDDYESGEAPYDIKGIDFVYINKDDGAIHPYYGYVDGK